MLQSDSSIILLLPVLADVWMSCRNTCSLYSQDRITCWEIQFFWRLVAIFIDQAKCIVVFILNCSCIYFNCTIWHHKYVLKLQRKQMKIKPQTAIKSSHLFHHRELLQIEIWINIAICKVLMNWHHSHFHCCTERFCDNFIQVNVLSAAKTYESINANKSATKSKQQCM